MTICSVFGCDSNNDKRLKKNEIESVRTQIKFFRFPKNKVFSKIWLQKCKRSDNVNLNNAYICSKHFTSEHYLRNLQHELLKYSPKSCRKLKVDAIPTENLPGKQVVKDSSRQERQVKRNQKEIVRGILATLDETLEPTVPTDIIKNEEICFVDTNQYLDKATSTNSLEESTTKALENELLQLRATNIKLQKECHFLKKETEYISKIFTPTQLRKMRNNGQRVKWTLDDISKSIDIYANGSKAYRCLLKQKYPFPAVSTLKAAMAEKAKAKNGKYNKTIN